MSISEDVKDQLGYSENHKFLDIFINIAAQEKATPGAVYGAMLRFLTISMYEECNKDKDLFLKELMEVVRILVTLGCKIEMIEP